MNKCSICGRARENLSVWRVNDIRIETYDCYECTQLKTNFGVENE